MSYLLTSFLKGFLKYGRKYVLLMINSMIIYNHWFQNITFYDFSNPTVWIIPSLLDKNKTEENIVIGWHYSTFPSCLMSDKMFTILGVFFYYIYIIIKLNKQLPLNQQSVLFVKITKPIWLQIPFFPILTCIKNKPNGVYVTNWCTRRRGTLSVPRNI